jgi:hypothetical protein
MKICAEQITDTPFEVEKDWQSRLQDLVFLLVGPVGIEPTTEGLWGGSKRSDWSSGVGLVRVTLSFPSGGVGLVCGMKLGIFVLTLDLILSFDFKWKSPVRQPQTMRIPI